MSWLLKHRNFVTEQLGSAPIDEIPGMDVSFKQELTRHGFTKAYHLLGQYLVLNKDKDDMDSWLAEMGCIGHRSRVIIEALDEWCEINL